MHPDIHLLLHHTRATDLRRTAPLRQRRPQLRTRLGWTMVELGLRLATAPARRGPYSTHAAHRPSPSVS
ncbi:hypothetical protein [Streptomyces flavofungini]|uniref:hypothetical protein n=1 Tax=Streptomyces flavofungini TaxID=68200 RepID=UPI0034DEDDEC